MKRGRGKVRKGKTSKGRGWRGVEKKREKLHEDLEGEKKQKRKQNKNWVEYI